MATQQSVQESMKRAASDVKEGDLEGLKKDVSIAAQQAGKVVQKEYGRFRKNVVKTANQVSTTAKSHPGWTAGILFGAGALLGAVLYGAIRPRPTGMQLFGRSLRNAWAQARDSARSGYESLQQLAH